MSEAIPGEDSREYWRQRWTQEPRHHWEAFRCKQFTATSKPNKTLLQPTTRGSPQLSSFDRLGFSALRNAWFNSFSFCFFSEILEQCFSDLLKQVVTTLPGNNQRPNECDSSWWEPVATAVAQPQGPHLGFTNRSSRVTWHKGTQTFTSHLGLEEHEALACHKDRVAGPLLVLSRLLRKGLREGICGQAAPVLCGGELGMLMRLPSF